jgi:branched-chain amino acid aminotransferase
MQANQYLHHNGKIYKADKLLISPNNRSFRYGDGFFETMKMINGKIILADYHFERLFTSLELLQFEKPNYFTADYLKAQIEELAKKNYHTKLARIRLMIFRGDGGLYDPENYFPNHLIQTWELNPTNNILNENGFVVDIFKDARKACDNYSHVKSNNYLPYAMAALWAKKKQLNDALLLNNNDCIADATIANIFIIKDGIIKTPALSEGCISGVMRRHLLKCMRGENIPVKETKIEVEELLQASEVFLSNGVYGIRWIKSCCNNNYTNALATVFHKKFVNILL